MLIAIIFGYLLDPAERVGSYTFLLFGPPGTGRTLFALSLARKHDMTFFKVDTAALTSKWVGDTEKYDPSIKSLIDITSSWGTMLIDYRIIKALSDLAVAHKPSLIFFDEIEGVIRERQGDEASFDRRFKKRLLEMFNQLSETPSVMVIGATNRPWDIDEAFLSRFQRKVFFGLPRREDYMAMLSGYLNGKRAKVAQYEIDLLCTFMENYSGREVAAAFKELNMKMLSDLMESSSFIPVS